MGNAEAFMDLIKDKALQFSWDAIINIPTTESGKPHNHPRQILSLEIYQADLHEFINLLEGYQSLSDDQVTAFSR